MNLDLRPSSADRTWLRTTEFSVSPYWHNLSWANQRPLKLKRKACDWFLCQIRHVSHGPCPAWDTYIFTITFFEEIPTVGSHFPKITAVCLTCHTTMHWQLFVFFFIRKWHLFVFIKNGSLFTFLKIDSTLYTILEPFQWCAWNSYNTSCPKLCQRILCDPILSTIKAKGFSQSGQNNLAYYSPSILQ